jgi:hypothetical protein
VQRTNNETEVYETFGSFLVILLWGLSETAQGGRCFSGSGFCPDAGFFILRDSFAPLSYRLNQRFSFDFTFFCSRQGIAQPGRQ